VVAGCDAIGCVVSAAEVKDVAARMTAAAKVRVNGMAAL
jgi:hypothetical protein